MYALKIYVKFTVFHLTISPMGNQGQKLAVAQWRVKTDQGYQKLRVECPVCDYATEFHNIAM